MKDKTIKKIAILYSGGKSFGGIERYLLDLVNNVDDQSVELQILSLGEWELTRRLKESGHKPVIFNKKRVSLKTINAIGRYLKDNEFNLLVSQGTVANAYARSISLLYKIPNLVTVHSSQTDDYSNVLVRNTYKTLEKLTRFPTVKYIAVSKYIKSQLIKSGIKSDKISVIYNGVKFEKTVDRQHRRLVIGSVGRLHQVKGFDVLIRAFALLKNKRLRLKIAGDGDELGNLKVLACDLGVADRIEFVGYQKDVINFLDNIDVYVQPSRSEGFGLAVVEAMSRCLPVVVTPAGSLTEIVKDQKTGLIAKNFSSESLANTIAEQVDNYEKSKQMGDSARKYVVDNFNVKQWVEDTIKTYKETIK